MKIKELLTPSTWTQFTEARNKENLPCKYNDPAAVRWCLMGAFNKCYGLSDSSLEADDIYNRIRKETNMYITDFNDKHRFEDVYRVVEMLDV